MTVTNDSRELLVEDWGSVSNFQNSSRLIEYITSESGDVYIEGIFMQAEKINGNRRLYPKHILAKAVDKYIREQINTKQSIGELNHPPRAKPDPLHAAILIEKLWWEGNNVMGRAKVITGDGAEGDKTAALLRAGWIPGVSSRGLGSVKQVNGVNVVQEGYELTVAVDVVWGPSAPDAYVKPVFEQKQEEVKHNLDSQFLALSESLQKTFTK